MEQDSLYLTTSQCSLGVSYRYAVSKANRSQRKIRHVLMVPTVFTLSTRPATPLTEGVSSAVSRCNLYRKDEVGPFGHFSARSCAHNISGNQRKY